MIKTMNIKKATNSQLSTTESSKINNSKSKTKQKNPPKQTARRGTETESQVWKSFRGLSAVRGQGKKGGNDAGIKKHNWYIQNRQGGIKNTIGNGEAKELICMTHGHELRGDCWREGEYQAKGNRGEKLGQL